MDSEKWDGWLERTILVLVGAALGFGILAFGGVRPRDFVIVEVLVAMASLVWLVRIWSVKDNRLLWPPVCWGVLLFAGWAVWRATQADIPYLAWAEVMRILTYTALFFVVLNNLHRQYTAQGLAWFVVGLATLLCFYAAWQATSGANTVWGLDRVDPDYVRRGSGSYVNPNHFAGFLELLLPLALSMAIASRMKALGRVLLIYATLVMLAGLVFSFSRGGWIAAGFGMGLVLITLARSPDYRRAALITMVFLAVLGTGVMLRSEVMKRRLQTSFDLSPQARNSRPNIWRPTVAMWKDHLWLGVGPAHFNERFKTYRNHWAHGEPERAHNDYLNALADWGVAGTAIAAVPWALLAYGAGRTLRQVRRDPGSIEVKRSGRYAFVLGACASLAALLAHSITDFNFHIPGNALVAVAWIGLLAGYSRYATDDWWVSSRKPWRLFMTLLILGLAGALGRDFAVRGREQWHLVRSSKLPLASDAQLAELMAAWKIAPGNAWNAYEIGEIHRLRSFTGMEGYKERAAEALTWFARAGQTNRFNPAFPIREGMCLDWIGRHDEAGERFKHAHQLDPEGHVTSCFLGWHELQVGNDAAAREWFIKSTEQAWPPYEPAMNYLRLLEARARQRAGLPPAPQTAAPQSSPSQGASAAPQPSAKPAATTAK